MNFELYTFQNSELRKQIKVAMMNSGGEFEAAKYGNNMLSLTIQWKNRNQRSKMRIRKKPVSISFCANLQVVIRFLVFFSFVFFGRVGENLGTFSTRFYINLLILFSSCNCQVFSLKVHEMFH